MEDHTEIKALFSKLEEMKPECGDYAAGYRDGLIYALETINASRSPSESPEGPGSMMTAETPQKPLRIDFQAKESPFSILCECGMRMPSLVGPNRTIRNCPSCEPELHDRMQAERESGFARLRDLPEGWEIEHVWKTEAEEWMERWDKQQGPTPDELEEFRQRFPDHPVAKDHTAWLRENA